MDNDTNHRRACNDVICELGSLAPIYPAASSILAYLKCCKCYRIKCVVMGKVPYSSSIVPTLGSSFSQTSESKDTPTSSMFSLHFDDHVASLSMIRDSWSVLPSGYMFANADFLPSEMGGGDNNIDCILRVDRMSELMVSILRHGEESWPITLIAVGKLALYSCTLIAKRLKALGQKVVIRSCKQPASLATLTSNKHMIGKNEKYSFASGECMKIFRRIVSSYSQGRPRSVRDIIHPILIHKMSKNIMPRQTKQALMDIHTASSGSCTAVQQRLRDCESADTIEKLKDVVSAMGKELHSANSANKDMATFLMADSYEYKSLLDAAAAQIPSATKSQKDNSTTVTGIPARGTAATRSVASTPTFGSPSSVSKNSMFTRSSGKKKKKKSPLSTAPSESVEQQQSTRSRASHPAGQHATQLFGAVGKVNNSSDIASALHPSNKK